MESQLIKKTQVWDLHFSSVKIHSVSEKRKVFSSLVYLFYERYSADEEEQKKLLMFYDGCILPFVH